MCYLLAEILHHVRSGVSALGPYDRGASRGSRRTLPHAVLIAVLRLPWHPLKLLLGCWTIMLQVVALSEHLYALQGSLRPLCPAAVMSAGHRLTVLC